MLLAFILMFFPSSTELTNDGTGVASIVSIFAVVGSMLFANLAALLVVLISFVPRLNKGILTTHTLTIDDAGVTEETAVNQSRAKWSGVLRVRQNRSFIFIYLTEYSAHVIPKRAFPAPVDAENFFKQAVDAQRACDAA
jgi:hypothetical protein